MFFLQAPEDALPSVVRSAMLQVVFDRANLSLPSMSDADVEVWLTSRLPPLLVQLSPGQVAPYFGILAGRSCSIEQLGWAQSFKHHIWKYLSNLTGNKPLHFFVSVYWTWTWLSQRSAQTHSRKSMIKSSRPSEVKLTQETSKLSFNFFCWMLYEIGL